jgi:hypothetical protein
MSGAASWGDPPHHGAVRAAVAAFVRAFGRKRGLYLAAQAIGIGERAARHAHEGGPVAADPERARRADEARLALLNDEIQRLRAEAAELKRSHHVGNDGARMDARGRVLRASRSGVLPASAS